jgi:acyl-coenzyme A synthetase/AMP-(fatty) acid ligase
MANYGFVSGQSLKGENGHLVKTGIAACECPRKIEFVADMPRTVTAKTQSRLLRAGEVE